MPAQKPTDPVAENLAAHDDPTPMAFDSAEDPDNERLVAPAGYRPHYVATPAVMDDDLKDTEWMNAWRTYFASGSNHPHWFIIDHDGEAHMVEMVTMSGSYQAYGRLLTPLRERLRRLLDRRDARQDVHRRELTGLPAATAAAWEPARHASDRHQRQK